MYILNEFIKKKKDWFGGPILFHIYLFEKLLFLLLYIKIIKSLKFLQFFNGKI